MQAPSERLPHRRWRRWLATEAAAITTASATVSRASSTVPAVSVAARLGRRGHGQVGLAGGKDREEAVRAFAVAGCLDAFYTAEGHMQQAALAAVRGREGVGHAGRMTFSAAVSAVRRSSWARKALKLSASKLMRLPSR